MVLVIVVAVAALTLVLATGHGPQLATLRLRAVRLLVVTALLQVATALWAPDSGAARTVTMIVTGVLVSLFLWGNRAVRGVPLMAAGLLLNGVVIASNGAMPVSSTAAAEAGVPAGATALQDQPLREALDGQTRFPLLADRVPVPAPGWSQVVSVGDVLVASGVGLLLIAGSVPDPGRRRTDHPRRQPARRPERSMAFVMESTTRGSYS